MQHRQDTCPAHAPTFGATGCHNQLLVRHYETCCGMCRNAAPGQGASDGAEREPVVDQPPSSGDVIYLSDDDARPATKRPIADPHSGDNYGQQRATDISSLLIRSILNQETRAKRYLDALDRLAPQSQHA